MATNPDSTEELAPSSSPVRLVQSLSRQPRESRVILATTVSAAATQAVTGEFSSPLVSVNSGDVVKEFNLSSESGVIFK